MIRMKKKEEKWIEFEEKIKKLKQEALRCRLSGDYDGAYNAFTKMNNLFPSKYRVLLERFKTGYE